MSKFVTRFWLTMMLDSLITSKTRIKLLLKFFSNPHTKSYLRSLAEEFEESTNAVRVELNRLSEAGFLLSKNEGNTVIYRANTSHPLFPEIAGIVTKYLGLDSLIEEVINNLGDLKQAWVTGDYAQGKDSGLIDLVLVGNLDHAYLDALVSKAEGIIRRKIRVLVLSEAELPEFRAKLDLDKAILLFEKEL
ncbi:MAG TPA: ArsR family transcriptional regulator [Cyclobacteriaceae bacterium]|nr:ArsR family transcriptional regulator [Cyclobacteriaceae bacterium]